MSDFLSSRHSGVASEKRGWRFFFPIAVAGLHSYIFRDEAKDRTKRAPDAPQMHLNCTEMHRNSHLIFCPCGPENLGEALEKTL
jgi:hypothetical protein